MPLPLGAAASGVLQQLLHLWIVEVFSCWLLSLYMATAETMSLFQELSNANLHRTSYDTIYIR